MSGICKFGPRLKELRVHLCQTGAASKGVRDFIKQHYVNIKSNNPETPILIRECAGVEPKVWARYEYGKEISVPLTNLAATEVLQSVETLASKC